MEYTSVIFWYLVIALFFLVINSVIAGYNGKTYTAQDIKDSFLWVLSLSILLGLVIRIALDKYRNNT
jgi:hypothetical protein